MFMLTYKDRPTRTALTAQTGTNSETFRFPFVRNSNLIPKRPVSPPAPTGPLLPVYIY